MNPLAAIQKYLPQVAQADLAARPLSASTSSIPAAELKDLPPLVQIKEPTALAPTQPTSFAGLIGQLAQDVSAKQAAGAESVRALMSGENVSLHQVMISLEEAGLSFQLMVEVRNKLLESYQELMRMQV